MFIKDMRIPILTGMMEGYQFFQHGLMNCSLKASFNSEILLRNLHVTFGYFDRVQSYHHIRKEISLLADMGPAKADVLWFYQVLC